MGPQMTTLNQCDTFTITLGLDNSSLTLPQYAAGSQYVGDAVAKVLAAPNFTNVVVSGFAVSGTYVGQAPYTLPDSFSITETDPSSSSWVVYTFPVIASQVTGTAAGCSTGSVNSQLSPLQPGTKIKRPSPTSTPAAASATASSTGAKVAVGAAAIGGTALVATLVVSAVTGWGVGKVLDKAWDKLRGK
jgi:hypothetical protein